jgi:hypothetical protein
MAELKRLDLRNQFEAIRAKWKSSWFERELNRRVHEFEMKMDRVASSSACLPKVGRSLQSQPLVTLYSGDLSKLARDS